MRHLLVAERAPARAARAVQSRTMSLVEALANVVVGFCLAVAMQMTVFPLFGLSLPLAQNLLIGVAFTGVSVVRSYLLRRLFEAIRMRRPWKKGSGT